MQLSEHKVYDDPQAFWREVSPELKKEEAKNSLFLGLSRSFQFAAGGSNSCLYQSALRGESGLLAALICSQYRTNCNLIPSPVEDIHHAKELFTEFAKSRVSITGIVGEDRTADIYRTLFEAAGKKTKVHMSQGIYRCSKVRMPRGSEDLTFRMAELTDAKKIGDWIEAFHHEAVPHDPPINGRTLAEAKIAARQISVLEKNGVLVSMAGWGRDIETSCSVNLVYTPKDQRKNGFGSQVTARLTRHLLDGGKTETNLYTDLSNPTSNKIYQEIGYEFVCHSVHLGVFD